MNWPRRELICVEYPIGMQVHDLMIWFPIWSSFSLTNSLETHIHLFLMFCFEIRNPIGMRRKSILYKIFQVSCDVLLRNAWIITFYCVPNTKFPKRFKIHTSLMIRRRDLITNLIYQLLLDSFKYTLLWATS